MVVTIVYVEVNGEVLDAMTVYWMKLLIILIVSLVLQRVIAQVVIVQNTMELHTSKVLIVMFATPLFVYMVLSVPSLAVHVLVLLDFLEEDVINVSAPYVPTMEPLLIKTSATHVSVTQIKTGAVDTATNVLLIVDYMVLSIPILATVFVMTIGKEISVPIVTMIILNYAMNVHTTEY